MLGVVWYWSYNCDSKVPRSATPRAGGYSRWTVQPFGNTKASATAAEVLPQGMFTKVRTVHTSIGRDGDVDYLLIISPPRKLNVTRRSGSQL